jgi:hypothetical protein
VPQNLDDLNSNNLKTGICVLNGWILFELMFELTFNEIDIHGSLGDQGIWSPNLGAGAKILTSMDKINWTEVGTIPNTFGTNIQRVNLTNSTAKYIKFELNSHIGIGHLKIIQN